MNHLPIEKRAQILGLLVEGNSMRSITRLVGCSINTVTKLLVDVGQACSEYQDKAMRNLPCKRIQCDEIWAFCGMKEKNVPEENKGELGYGDVYTWTALDPDSKLIVSFLVGRRDYEYAEAFIGDLADRLANRVQLTTDGHKPYLSAVEGAFGGEIDFAQLVKIYGPAPTAEQRRYSPARFTGADKTIISGNPDMAKVSTSHVERQNLTMRMSMRRFTRLTNGFSKKIENLEYAVALHFMFYNFGRIHKTLRVTPAMEAGISDHVWTLEEIAGLVKEEPPKKRGPYKKTPINL
ncbi:MAG: DDE-type integrase/transposase/recombinase [Hydrogenophilales bacterium]|nr:DDE-type integrase/transposase/recombinase [Hydrogenophilales bacterium]